jgi:hypothetical protein
LIGIFGVVVGIALNEYLRRMRRSEEYASVIFAKRLDAYEKLMDLINQGSELAREAIDNPKLSSEERHDLVTSAVVAIAEHVDRATFYINEELGANCVALFMGTEDIHNASEQEKSELLKNYYKMHAETKRMIREDSGVAQTEKLFHSINRPRITSPVIERIRELRAEQARKKS